MSFGKRVVSRKLTEQIEMVFLPCLRCGLDAVPVSVFFMMNPRTIIMCSRRNCEEEHYLAVRKRDNQYQVTYGLYTLRYPLESYDEGVEPALIRLHSADFLNPPETHGGPGPVIVYPRKKRYSRKEIEAIWEASKGKCHLCGHVWKLDERGVKGWHIDHIIPHAGGGPDTEELRNLRVACAQCNLKKGRGYTEKRIRLAIHSLVEWIDSKERQKREFRRGT